MNIRPLFLLFAFFTVISCTSIAQHHSNEVTVKGAMKNVMWKGELDGIIDLDTLKQRKNLYGLGPVEYLAGEILILDGKSYKSTVVSATEMTVEETFKLKAPFFGYAHVKNWEEHPLPNSVRTIKDLELYVDQITKQASRPFMFRLTGTIDYAKIHVVNLPPGSKVSSPKEAHQGQVDYELTNEPSELLGFFSTEHKTIFTHHDTFLHMHLITQDRTKMGHLDEAIFKPEMMKLYLPK